MNGVQIKHARELVIGRIYRRIWNADRNYGDWFVVPLAFKTSKRGAIIGVLCYESMDGEIARADNSPIYFRDKDLPWFDVTDCVPKAAPIDLVMFSLAARS